MEAIELVKTTLLEMIETAGESGVTEGQASREIVKRHKIGHYETLEILRSVYKEIGLERTSEHTGAVIFYRKPKQSEQKKEPEESAAVRIAKKLGKRNMGEKGRMEILKHYM